MPDLHNGLDLEKDPNQKVKFIKTHVLFDAKLPHVERTLGFIYIARHPLDVMLANMNFELLFSGLDNGKRKFSKFEGWNRDSIEAYKQQFFRDFIRDRGFRYWENFGIGTLDQHMHSWKAAARLKPSLMLRYEDMSNNIFEQTMKISRFLRIKPSQDAMEKAISYASFSNLKKIENKDIEQGDTTLLTDFPGIEIGYRLKTYTFYPVRQLSLPNKGKKR